MTTAQGEIVGGRARTWEKLHTLKPRITQSQPPLGNLQRSCIQLPVLPSPRKRASSSGGSLQKRPSLQRAYSTCYGILLGILLLDGGRSNTYSRYDYRAPPRPSTISRDRHVAFFSPMAPSSSGLAMNIYQRHGSVAADIRFRLIPVYIYWSHRADVRNPFCFHHDFHHYHHHHYYHHLGS